MQIHELNNFTGTLGAGAYLAVDDGSDTGKVSTNELSNPKYITVDELLSVPSGVYTLGTVTIDNPIRFPRQNNRGIIIVDTIFNINTSVLFPAYSDISYFILPSFIGCIFNNLTLGRVLVTSGSNDTVASRITGCIFNNVDMVANTGYVQDFNFTNCYIASYDTFLECANSTVQARFVNCSVESECNKLIVADKLVGYFSGTFEGNISEDYYFVNCNYGVLEFNSCWLEACKMLALAGGSTTQKRTVININSCEIQGGNSSDKTVANITDATYVSLYISGSQFVPYDSNSRFTNASPDSFETIKGRFDMTTANTYCHPIGGNSTLNKELATVSDVENLENKRFIYYKCQLTQTVINGGGLDFELPVGQYLMLAGTGYYSVMDKSRVGLLGATTESATQTNYHDIINAPSGSWVADLTFTLTKQNATDKTFNLNINAVNAYTYFVTLIRLY